MSYKEKYLKYKTKYLNLKIQLGRGKGDKDKGDKDKAREEFDREEKDPGQFKSQVRSEQLNKGIIPNSLIAKGALEEDKLQKTSAPTKKIEIPPSDIVLINDYMEKDYDTVNRLVDQNSTKNDSVKNNEGITPIMAILQNTIINDDNKMLLIDKLIKQWADVDSVNSDGLNVLLYALESGKSNRIIIKLIEYITNINIPNPQGNTPLMLAVMNNNIEVVQLLLRSGANVNVKNNKGNTALMIASAIKPPNIQIIKILLDNGADIDIKNNISDTAEIIAKNKTNMQIVQLLNKTRTEREQIRIQEEQARAQEEQAKRDAAKILSQQKREEGVRFMEMQKEEEKKMVIKMILDNAARLYLSNKNNYLISGTNNINYELLLLESMKYFDQFGKGYNREDDNKKTYQYIKFLDKTKFLNENNLVEIITDRIKSIQKEEADPWEIDDEDLWGKDIDVRANIVEKSPSTGKIGGIASSSTVKRVIKKDEEDW